jgi:hypothetical protein
LIVQVLSEWEQQRADYCSLRLIWRESPLLYVRQRFGLEPTLHQQQALGAILPPGAKVTIRSGHGVGKSSVAAMIVCWFLETHDYAKVPCTAPSAHQLRDVLWGELVKWQRHADAQSVQRGDSPRLWLSRLFKTTTERMYDISAPDWGAVARTGKKESPEALQGFHAEYLLFVIDEASGVPEEVFEAAEGALSTASARVLMLGNPTRNLGTFAASHKANRGEYTALHFRSQDSPLVDPQYRPRLVRKFGEDSNLVRVRCDGEFPHADEDTLIGIEHTEPCLSREEPAATGERRLGVDVARFGDDRTVLLVRQGPVVSACRIFRKQDTMQTVGEVLRAIHDWQIEACYIDVIGLGAGVVDRLLELQQGGAPALRTCRLHAVNVAESAERYTGLFLESMKPRLLRDALWLEMARWCREESPVFCCVAREHNEDLAGELCTPTYRIDSSGRIVVEPKDAMKKRLGHSPDLADALGCTFAIDRGYLSDLDLGGAFDDVRVSPWALS